MATALFYIVVFQLVILFKSFVVEGGNSSALAVNNSDTAVGNGITTGQFSNSTNSSSPTLLKFTRPTTVKVDGTRRQSTEQPHNATLRTGQDAVMTPSTIRTVHQVSSKKQNVTGVGISASGTVSSAAVTHFKRHDDLPFWVYIIIAFGVIFIITTVVVAVYARLDKWKNHGSYMVWDENELELSPAFTRESEFLLDNLAADHEPGTPELQIYEIPLDSLGHQRVYIGAKRVAPKSEEPKAGVKLPSRLKKKNEQQFQGNTLPRLGKRDHIYSSVNDEVASALSEGNLCEPSHLLTKVPRGSSPPDIVLREMRPLTVGSRSRSGSNLFHNRPLPPAPYKRFSRSLDRLRFFDTLSHSKPKGITYPGHHRPSPIQAHSPLIKSSSFGGAFNKITNGSFTQPPLPPPRKGSIDFYGKPAFGSNLCHRHSKSLDTLLFLRELDWATFDINIYHSYESVRSNKSENSKKEPSYESVNRDEKPSSNQSSERTSIDSKGSTISGSTSGSPERQGDSPDENPYASVSEDETSKTATPNECDQGTPDLNHDQRVSLGETTSMLSPGSDPASPYASVRISQIPELVSSHSHTSRGDSGLGAEDFDVGELGYSHKEGPKSERLSTHTYLELLPDSDDKASSGKEARDKQENQDSDRLSTHTYLELFPDTGRDSVISETSSGYARPIDILPGKQGQTIQTTWGSEDSNENRKSLSDLEIPLESSATLESNPSSVHTLEACPSLRRSQADDSNAPLDDVTSNFEDSNGLRDNAGFGNSLPSRESENDLKESRALINKFPDRTREAHVYENTQFLQSMKNGESISGQSVC